MNQARGVHAAVVFKGEIYAIGGLIRGENGTLDSVEKYNPEKNEWTYVSKMTTSRAFHNAAIFDGTIFVTGGFKYGKFLCSAERYHHPSRRWLPVQHMKVERASHALVALSGFLYALGGARYTCGGLNSVERYDLKTKKWKLVSFEGEKYPSNFRLCNFKFGISGCADDHCPTWISSFGN